MHVLKRLTIIVVVGTAAGVYAGPLAYATCQTACNLGACACYAAAGLTFGTVTLGAVAGGPITWWAWFFGGAAATGTAAATACSAAQGICMAACTPLLVAPTP
ncbi:hypothetical protein HDU79_011977 [Rhizoclosmatium sp. JEL0117]|nr:hypothetical protein HDU79_011977 [Rhizoclosmatium sp. JEL0117]